ncbi:MAG: hypothetical protein ACRD2G_06750 [Terriglobia bacterium]
MFRLIPQSSHCRQVKLEGHMPRPLDLESRTIQGFRSLWFHLALAAVVALAFFPGVGQARHQDNAADLEARIQREKNPVKKAKLQIRLGRLDLDQAADAYDHQKMSLGQKLLSESTDEMEDAWTLLKSTGRSPAKKPDGFMQLEIGLREETRALGELRRRVFYLYRGPVDSTLKTLTQMHSQVLVGLFPGAAPASSGPNAEKRKIPAYQNPGKGAFQ